DLNVPLDAAGCITDATRIVATLPTIRYVLEHGGLPIVASHLGRPKGGPAPELSLRPVADYLRRALDLPVELAPNCVGDAVESLIGRQRPGQVVVLENLRFHPEEEKNDPVFAERLARLADVYVDDAFGAAHRAHASTAGVARFFRSKAAGLLLRREVDLLRHLLVAPAKPFVAVLGGAKVSDKIGVLENLLGRVQAVCIGGAMAYTFLRAQGKPVGRSRVEADKVDFAAATLARAAARGVRIRLPVDHLAADRPHIAGNWKMRGARGGGEGRAGRFAKGVGRVRGREVVIAPPFTALEAVRPLIAGTDIHLAGQNVHWEPKGAYTGEIAVAMLRE